MFRQAITNEIYVKMLLIISFVTIISIHTINAQRYNMFGFFEYGAHQPGEVMSYYYEGELPPYKPICRLEVRSLNKAVQENYTYLRVEYAKITPKVVISYDPYTYYLTFHIKYPFVNIPIGVVGYALEKDEEISVADTSTTSMILNLGQNNRTTTGRRGLLPRF